jgi:hypothetical protein
MNMFIDITTGMELTEAEIRARHPSRLFPSPFRADEYPPLFSQPKPDVDPLTASVIPGPHQEIDGKWYRTWIVNPLSHEEQGEVELQATEAFKEMVVQNVQYRLDDFASTRGYDGTNSISKYQNLTDAQIESVADSTLRAQVSKFRDECQYLALATAATWAQLYKILGEVNSGQRPKPSTYEEIESELPTLEWPV